MTLRQTETGQMKDKLRAVFKRYGRHYSATTMHGDADEEFKKRLKRSKPEDLSPQEIGSVLLNYCSEPRSLKYYLPRLLELALQRTSGAPSLDEVKRRLHELDYSNWPEDERNAVEEYIAAFAE